jgi:hypothetical protein
MAQELKIVADLYDLMLWMTKHTEKFPRHHRYSLGNAIEGRLRAILALLIRAKYTADKVGPLAEANLELEVLRFEVRLARDVKALSFDRHEHAARLMQGIGAQVGGWLKSSAAKPRT